MSPPPPPPMLLLSRQRSYQNPRHHRPFTSLPATLTLTFTLILTFTVSEAQEDKGCPPGVNCLHGYCPAGTVSCVCDQGWAGFQCEQQCPDDCPREGSCQTTPEGIAYCYCGGRDRHYVPGRGCVSLDDLTTSTSTTTTTTTTTATTTTTTLTTTAFASKAAAPSNTTTSNSTLLPPFSERTCLAVPGFVCVHGRCMVSGKTLSCECLQGWTGSFCQDICTKNCSAEFGRCVVVANDTYSCECDPSHTGEFCHEETASPMSLPVNDTTKVTPQPPPAANSSLHSLEERVCGSHGGSWDMLLVCVHGRCVEEKKTDNQTAAAVFCTCDPGYGGPRCDVPSESGGQECVPGFPCVHGRCAEQGVRCVCHPGYIGEFCITPCAVDCVHGQCFVVGDNGTASCACEPTYTGSNCSELREQKDSTSGQLGTIEWADPDTLKPISERECVPGFVCVHGRCQENGIKCLCDPGYVGEFCHLHCPLQCVHGECYLAPNGTIMCSCEAQYTGPDCSELRPSPDLEQEDETVQWSVVGSCAGLMLVLLVLLVALPYWMWKRGHILVMRIVYHFKPFEDDDEKRYDAFISYCTVDEQFVVQELFPRLSAMSFTVCVHRKDFLPGETIANNIIEAVENSRRTILILTPHFIQSQFCRFEYQQAQYQMLQQKHRIVPIVLRDVSQQKRDMDATLRSILNTITYLEWPPDHDPRHLDKFWKRLELSMPKRKQSSRPSSSESSPATTTTTTTASGSTRGDPSSLLYSRLDSSSSGYSTESASSFASGKTASSFVSAPGKPARVSSSFSSDSGHAGKVKKSGSISGQSTSSRGSPHRPAGHSSGCKEDGRGSSESRSRSKSTRKNGGVLLRPESVLLEMEQGQGRGDKGSARRQEFVNPAYAMP